MCCLHSTLSDPLLALLCSSTLVPSFTRSLDYPRTEVTTILPMLWHLVCGGWSLSMSPSHRVVFSHQIIPPPSPQSLLKSLSKTVATFRVTADPTWLIGPAQSVR